MAPKTTDLPPEILFSNILPRLPARSLSRFKSVSKQRHSFLRTPAFLQMHHLHVINADDRQIDQRLLFLPSARPWEYRTIDCETPKGGFTATRPFPFKVGGLETISIVASFHGMICVRITKRMPYYDGYSDSDLILWNPVTDDHKTLPKTGCFETTYLHKFELYYSSSENDYKLVQLCGPHAHIYSLKSESWRIINSIGDEYDTIELLGMEEHSYMKTWGKLVTSSSKEYWCGGGQRLHLMRNGSWLMYFRVEDYVCVLDRKKHTKHTMCYISFAFYPGAKYMETFVSPNQYIN